MGDDIKFLNPLEEEEQRRLFREYEETKDLEIREKLILHNLKLVSWTISKYYYDRNILENDDYFQTGTIGLMRAIETYDQEIGAFSTYCIYAIRQAVERDIENFGRTIRVPSYMVAKVNKVKRIKEEISSILERDPTAEEISFKIKLPLEEINEILKVVDDPVSLNMVTSTDSEDLTLESTIKDDSPTPDELVESKIFIEQFKEIAKDKLSKLQYDSITMYLGIGTREHSLEEIAYKHDHSSREYIRNERDKGLRILRRTRYFLELRKEFEEETSYYKSIDYSRPRSSGGLPTSSVENIALERERRLERIEKRYSDRERLKKSV